MDFRKFYVAVEGVEGSGKTELCDYLMAEVDRHHDDLTILYVKEPGGTPLGNSIRSFLIRHGRSSMDVLSQLHLFMAARRHNFIKTNILLDRMERQYEANNCGGGHGVKGCIILLDRFIDSTFVYQGILGGIDLRLINDYSHEAWPIDLNLTITLDGDPKSLVKRVTGRKEPRDKLASEEAFLVKVSSAFKVINNTKENNSFRDYIGLSQRMCYSRDDSKDSKSIGRFVIGETLEAFRKGL